MSESTGQFVEVYFKNCESIFHQFVRKMSPICQRIFHQFVRENLTNLSANISSENISPICQKVFQQRIFHQLVREYFTFISENVSPICQRISKQFGIEYFKTNSKKISPTCQIIVYLHRMISVKEYSTKIIWYLLKNILPTSSDIWNVQLGILPSLFSKIALSSLLFNSS